MKTSNEKKRPLFSILHTSARPDKWREIYNAWIGSANRPEDVEYVLCVDERWGFKSKQGGGIGGDGMPDDAWFHYRGGYLNKMVWNEGRRCYVDGVNIAAKASTGHILIVNADDQYPMQEWDSALWQMIMSSDDLLTTSDTTEGRREFVVEVSTGTPDEHDRGGNPIIVMPVISRARYERLGYIFFPDYESMFSDNDLHDHAVHDGVLVQAHELMFPHRHPLFDDKGKWTQKEGTFDQSKWDKAYQEQNRKEAYQLGSVILKWRRRIRFGDAIHEAEQIEGWMTPAELSWLSRSASQRESIIEIGSWKGRSTYALCSGTTGNVYAVDHWDWTRISDDGMQKAYQRSESGSGSTDVYNDFVRNIVDHFPNALAIRKNSVEAAKTLPNAEMVFIDGAHDYESVKQDLEVWLPKTTHLICGHDYSPASEHEGVVRAVTEVLGQVTVIPGTTIWCKLIGTPIIKGMGQPNGKIIAWCLPGEFFQAPMVSSILKLYAYLLTKGYYVVMHQVWTSSPYVTREALRKSIDSMPNKPHLVLWTDDDNPVSPEIFERLLRDLESAEEISSVAGWTWVDMYNGSFSVSAGIFTEDKTAIQVIPVQQINSETRLIEVEWHGFPVVLMKYETLVKAGDKPFAGIPAPNSQWGITGEDTAFCLNLKARSPECRIFVDPLAFVPHLKYGSIGPDGGKDKQGATVEEMNNMKFEVK